MNTGMKVSLTAVVLLGLAGALPAMAGSVAACTAHGQAALEAWSHGHYDQAGRDFSPAVAQVLPPAKLEAAWTTVQQEAGAFQTLGKLQPRSLGGQQVLVAPMAFAGMAGAALIACDASDHIIGFRVVPASKLPPAAAPAAAASVR